ncbi:MAG TPA: hypothetical protein VIJ33_04420 [Solirubrobacteraceae bacterium]
MTRKQTRRGACILALAATLAAAAVAAGAGKPNTFTLSGQLGGTMTLNSSSCASDNIQTADGVTTLRLYLTDHGVKPTSATWFMLMSAKKAGTVTYPARYPDEVSLGAAKGAVNADEWNTMTKGSGSLTLNAGFKSGTISLSMSPAVGQHGATHTEKIVGSWSC